MDQDLIAWCTKPELKGHYFLNCYRSKVLHGIAQPGSLCLDFLLSKNPAMPSDDPFRLLTSCSGYRTVPLAHPSSPSQPPRKPLAWGLTLTHSSPTGPWPTSWSLLGAEEWWPLTEAPPSPVHTTTTQFEKQKLSFAEQALNYFISVAWNGLWKKRQSCLLPGFAVEVLKVLPVISDGLPKAKQCYWPSMVQSWCKGFRRGSKNNAESVDSLNVPFKCRGKKVVQKTVAKTLAFCCQPPTSQKRMLHWSHSNMYCMYTENCSFLCQKHHELLNVWFLRAVS